MRSALSSFRCDRRGGILVFFVVCLPVLVATTGFVIDLVRAQTLQTELQRIADSAALAAGNELDFGGDALSRATEAAKGLVNKPHFAASASGLQIITPLDFYASLSPDVLTSDSYSAKFVRVRTVQRTSQGWFTRILGWDDAVVDAEAWAASGATQPGCILALKTSGTGVTLSGGTILSAPGCTVSSNNNVTVPCGTYIQTRSVTYNSAAAPSQPCKGIIAPPGSGASVSISREYTADPFIGDANVSAATSRLATVSALTAPTLPTVPAGTAVTFSSKNTSTTQGQLKTIGCTGAFASSKWTVTCPNGGTYNFAALMVDGGITLDFAVGGSSSTYNFSDLVSNTGGATANFGPGTYNMSKGLQATGGTTTNFGAGTFNIGQMAANCNGAQYSICHTGTTLTFGGPSTFKLTAGLYVSSTTLQMGAGTTNSYWFGGSTNGYAVNTGGGAVVSFADATGGASLARLLGKVSIGGGSCLRLPAAAQHDIKGSLDLGGGIIMGSGVYTITGYATFGAAYGGNVTCWGTSVGIQALNATFVLGGNPTSTTGSCSGKSFCVGAGYSTVTMTAPLGGSRLLVVGPLSGPGLTAGASFIQGAANQKLSGVFYYPNGPINLNGGASVLDGATHCLQIVGSEITLTGGTSAASACIDSVSPTGGLALVR